MLINGSPQPVAFAADLQRHLVQMPLVAGAYSSSTQPCSEGGAECGAPLADGLVADDDATLGDRARAVMLFEESLALCRALDDRLGAATALGNLGITARLEGRLDEARQYLEQAVALHKALRAQRASAHTLHSLGNVALDRGDLANAGICFREALALAEEVRDWTAVASCIESLAGILAMRHHKPERAAQLFGAAEVLREVTGIPIMRSARSLDWPGRELAQRPDHGRRLATRPFAPS
jgi:tetratricopeptide (TPR) repeat protein